MLCVELLPEVGCPHPQQHAPHPRVVGRHVHRQLGGGRGCVMQLGALEAAHEAAVQCGPLLVARPAAVGAEAGLWLRAAPLGTATSSRGLALLLLLRRRVRDRAFALLLRVEAVHDLGHDVRLENGEEHAGQAVGHVQPGAVVRDPGVEGGVSATAQHGAALLPAALVARESNAVLARERKHAREAELVLPALQRAAGWVLLVQVPDIGAAGEGGGG